MHGSGPNRLTDYSDEVVGIKRLGEVVGEPVPEDLASMFRRVESRHGDDRNAIASLTRSANQVVAAEDSGVEIEGAQPRPALRLDLRGGELNAIEEEDTIDREILNERAG